MSNWLLWSASFNMQLTKTTGCFFVNRCLFVSFMFLVFSSFTQKLWKKIKIGGTMKCTLLFIWFPLLWYLFGQQYWTIGMYQKEAGIDFSLKLSWTVGLHFFLWHFLEWLWVGFHTVMNSLAWRCTTFGSISLMFVLSC